MARTVNEKALRIKTLAYGKGYSARVQIGGVRKPVYAATVKELRAKIKASFACSCRCLTVAESSRSTMRVSRSHPMGGA